MDLTDGPNDGFLSNLDMPVSKRRQGDGSVMIWTGIVDQTIIGPFKDKDRVKLNSANKCDFMDETFFAWYKSHSFKMKCIPMHNKAPLHVAKLTCEFFEHKRFTG